MMRSTNLHLLTYLITTGQESEGTCRRLWKTWTVYRRKSYSR